MAQIHELNTESNVGVGLDFVTDNGESTGKVGFAALAGGVLEKYEETELAGKRRSVKRAIDALTQQVDDAVESIKTKADQTVLEQLEQDTAAGIGELAQNKADTTALEAETAARQAADKSIQTALESETTARQAADTALENRIDAAYIVETAEGAVASFEDGADGVSLKSCAVNIDYVSGGRTECNVNAAGKNLYSTLIGADDFNNNVNATHSNNNGVVVINMSEEKNSGVYSPLNSVIRTLIKGKTGKITYSFDIKSTVEGNTYVGYEHAGASGKNIGTNWQHVTITATTNGDPNAFVVFNYSGVAREVQVKNFQFELGSTATDYELYTGKTYNITFPATIYGGALDVTTGVLTSTLDADGNPLATPQVYQLEPQEIRTLLGTNNIWADCGNVSVEYRVDPTLAHESGGGSGGQGQKGDKGDKGDPGNDGYTPVKGVDYWTAADKQEMVQDVLAALPAWTGGSF